MPRTISNSVNLDPLLLDWVKMQASTYQLTCKEVIDRCIKQVRDGGGLRDTSTTQRIKQRAYRR